MMFTERPPLDRPKAAADAGFAAVEIQFPYDTPADAWARAIEDAKVGVSVINFPVGDMHDGGPGLAAMPGREAAFRAAVAEAVPYATALKPRNYNVLPGFPPVDTLGRDACLDALAGNLSHAAETLSPLGVRVVTEAVNTQDRPGFFLKSSSQAIEAIDRAGHPNLAIEHDLYHMHIMEGRLIERLGEIFGRIGHIQFADAPGRHEPGTGEIEFEPIFHAIDELGYDGWVAAEYVPSKRTEETLDWLQPWR
jgi:hydroxypyruvate isomerase